MTQTRGGGSEYLTPVECLFSMLVTLKLNYHVLCARLNRRGNNPARPDERGEGFDGSQHCREGGRLVAEACLVGGSVEREGGGDALGPGTYARPLLSST